MRIISLLPSATEIICGLGLRDRLVGVTHECDYPPDVADLPKVTKTFIPPDATSGEIDELVRARLKSEKALYSLDPPFCAGHWNPELVALAGGREVIGVAGERSAAISWEEIVAADPEVMVIACCGFDVRRTMQDMPILQARPHWNSLACVKAKRVHVVCGSSYFNRPGPRLVDSLEILSNLLHGLPETAAKADTSR